ncbi:MAG: hypothetical protein EAY81_05000 [Bacteroidetes bacterium]|nr:MAG: hypothetical protein EAY81_05000 [Bacteroidota bacterium]
MKKLFVVIAIIYSANMVNAQIFHHKDSTRNLPIWQLGVGGYMGTQFLHPEEKTIEVYWGNGNKNGFDQGLLLGIRLNIYKHWTLVLDARSIKKSGSVGSDNYLVPFHFIQKGTQLPCLLTYTIYNRKNQEFLGITGGLSFNRMSYQTYNPSIYLIRYPVEIDRAFKQRYTSYVFGLSKKLPITNRNGAVVFGEWEYNPEGFSIYYNGGIAQSHYRLSSIRLGLYVTL